MSSFEGIPNICPVLHPLAVLYGSETGTAQEVAEYVSSMARRRGFDASARSLDSVPLSDVFESSLAVFVVSTTGDGEVPGNMSTFWRFLLRRGLPGDSLRKMRFAVFGLGDSGYSKYNATARKLHARLLQLGAVELVGRGLGDDQSPRGMWGDLDPWLASLWSSLLRLKPLPKGTVVDDTPRLEPPQFTMSPVVDDDSNTRLPSAVSTLRDDLASCKKAFWDSMAPPRRKGHGGGPPALARLLVNRRLTTEGHFQDVRHLEFDVRGIPGGEDYGAGDVAWVHPSNDISAVETLASVMGLNLDQIVRIGPAARISAACPSSHAPDDGVAGEGRQGLTRTPQAHQPFSLPRVCTVRTLLRDVLDILGTPRRSFFELLSLFAVNEEEKEKLEELASPSGADLLYEYATREKRSYVEVFGDFPSCEVPPERLLELVPRLRPRGFSIASSALETPSVVHVCMAVVSFRTPYKRIRTGVCSSWLAALTPGAEVPLSIRPGTFKLPRSPHHPLVMVGPGTGVAPMRSVILERRRQRRAQQQQVGGGVVEDEALSPEGEGEGAPAVAEGGKAPDTLFFGCRFRDKDFLYEDDWATLSATGDLSLHTAFSRQNPDSSGGRVYVQRRIREQAAFIAGLIVDRGASILVSGSAKQMPQDVKEAFREALAGHEKVGGQPAADKLIKTMERQGRYCVEAWS